MTTRHALFALLLSILFITAGLVWQFDQYGLYAGGVLLGLAVSVLYDFDKKGGDGDG